MERRTGEQDERDGEQAAEESAPRRTEEAKRAGETPEPPKARRTEEIADIAWELRALSRSGGSDLSRPPTFITIYGKPIDLFLADLADRIEAAAKRERGALVAEAEAAKDARNRVAVSLGVEYAERCRECKAKSGNAAAIREALRKINRMCMHNGCDSRNSVVARLLEHLDMISAVAEAALAAPARNCERFDDYHDAVEAWQKEEQCLQWRKDGGTCKNDSLASELVPLCFARWLFAKAERSAE